MQQINKIKHTHKTPMAKKQKGRKSGSSISRAKGKAKARAKKQQQQQQQRRGKISNVRTEEVHKKSRRRHHQQQQEEEESQLKDMMGKTRAAAYMIDKSTGALRTVRGLRNLGNTCFFNSSFVFPFSNALHCLSHASLNAKLTNLFFKCIRFNPCSTAVSCADETSCGALP